jgi:hypothetical protein
MKGNTMNKTIGYFAIGAIVIDLVAVAYGAYYVHKTKQELENEIEAAKAETNKTVQKIGKALSSFEV